jgi:DNA-binding NarL/FixJ family response regulator
MQKRVLVVDDNEMVRLVVRSTLEMHTPFIVHEAVDGLDAIQKAETLNPDLVVMDLTMPRMHGLDASRTLKESHHPPQVVLFTVHKAAITESDATQAGLSAIVEKSEGLETLLHEVEHLLQPSH